MIAQTTSLRIVMHCLQELLDFILLKLVQAPKFSDIFVKHTN